MRGSDDISHSYCSFQGKTLYELPVWLVNSGYQLTTSPAYRWPGDERPRSVIWQYCLQGEGALTLYGENFRIGPGQAMLVTTPEEHCYYLPPDPGMWEFIYLTFSGEGAFAIADALRRNYNSVLTLNGEGPSVAAAKKIMETARCNGYSSPYEIADAATHFLYVLSQELEVTCDRLYNEPQFMKRIYSGFQRNPDMGMEEMVKLSGYSRRYLDRQFKAQTGESPAEFLRKLKLQKAAGMLQNTLLSVKEIAAHCGFYDDAYFCKQFAKCFGRTPAAYRR